MTEHDRRMRDQDRQPTLGERLRALHPGASGRALKQWLAAGRVRVDGQPIHRGDIRVPPQARVTLGPPAARAPAPLRVVHEDADIVVIDKPAGLLTVATESERQRTAYRLLRDWSEAQGAGRVFIVHRLDRETSGLLVFARSPSAKQALQAQFAARTAVRVYRARVEGQVGRPAGELRSRLTEGADLRVRAGGRRGALAVTRYRVLERDRDTTLLELTLVTGRRGQLRAQLAALGHPILGDRAYGSRRDPAGRLCLHATRLEFVHPNGSRAAYTSPPPPGLRPQGM